MAGCRKLQRLGAAASRRAFFSGMSNIVEVACQLGVGNGGAHLGEGSSALPTFSALARSADGGD